MLTGLEIAIGQKFRELTVIRRFRAAVADARRSQTEKLLTIIRDNRDTVFGKRHQFNKISSIADFQNLVPPSKYEDYSAYIQAMMNGQKGQLTASDPIMFATTSGTTSKPKFIPITPEHLRDYTDALQVHNYHVIKDHEPVTLGRFLIITSSDEEGVTDCGIPCGAISGLLNRRQPAIIRKHFALPYQLSRIKDVAVKYYLIMRISAALNVSVILCCNPSSLLLLADKMKEQSVELINDIYEGKLNPGFEVPKELAAGLQPYLQANRPAARALNRILEQEGILTPRSVWPGLSLISCWKGGSMGFYLEQLPDSYGDIPVRDFGYMASEGRGSIPISDDGAGGVLAVFSHFFEFVPEEGRKYADCRYLTADELDLHGRYYIHFTTAAGLYRYDINDLIEVVGFLGNTPVIKFIRKGAGFSSITGEKLTEEQVRDALSRAVRTLELTKISHFMAAVQLDRPPHYTCFVELNGPLPESSRKEFLRIFDQSLKEQNLEYRDKRDSLRLGAPELRVMPPGTYMRLRQRRVMEGAPEAQVKIPLLAPVGDPLIDKLQRAA